MPDQSSVIRSHAEEGIKVKWNNIHHPEESESPDVVVSKERIPGGGEGSEDLYEEAPENMDPEYIHLKEEYKDAQKGIRERLKTSGAIGPRSKIWTRVT